MRPVGPYPTDPSRLELFLMGFNVLRSHVDIKTGIVTPGQPLNEIPGLQGLGKPTDVLQGSLLRNGIPAIGARRITGC